MIDYFPPFCISIGNLYVNAAQPFISMSVFTEKLTDNSKQIQYVAKQILQNVYAKIEHNLRNHKYKKGKVGSKY